MRVHVDAKITDRIKGAVGYVEYAYTKKNNMPYMQVMNKDGKYVAPDDKTFEAAAAGADWFSVPGMGVGLPGMSGVRDRRMPGPLVVTVP